MIRSLSTGALRLAIATSCLLGPAAAGTSPVAAKESDDPAPRGMSALVGTVLNFGATDQVVVITNTHGSAASRAVLVARDKLNDLIGCEMRTLEPAETAEVFITQKVATPADGVLHLKVYGTDPLKPILGAPAASRADLAASIIEVDASTGLSRSHVDMLDIQSSKLALQEDLDACLSLGLTNSSFAAGGDDSVTNTAPVRWGNSNSGSQTATRTAAAKEKKNNN